MQNELCDLVIVDCECGGTDDDISDIVEIAAMRFDPRTMLPRVGCVDFKVKPKFPVSPEAAAINGYNEADWADAVELEEALCALFPMIEGAKWTGQNPAFDRGFCMKGARRLGLPWPKLGDYHMLDVGSLAYPLVLEGTLPSESQRYTMALFGLGKQGHRAMSDVRNSATILTKLIGAARLGYRESGITALGPILATPKTAPQPSGA